MTEFKTSQKKRKDNDEPIFLKKTFIMLNESPNDIVGWKSDGLSFHIKNQEKFADKIIPVYFKHNNFASFVRQLNFYGFKKVKQNKASDIDEKIIEFKHPLFQKGRMDLLIEIKRSLNGLSLSEQQELAELRQLVKTMTYRIQSMEQTIVDLNNVITDLSSIPANERQSRKHYLEDQLDESNPFKRINSTNSSNGSTTQSENDPDDFMLENDLDDHTYELLKSFDVDNEENSINYFESSNINFDESNILQFQPEVLNKLHPIGPYTNSNSSLMQLAAPTLQSIYGVGKMDMTGVSERCSNNNVNKKEGNILKNESEKISFSPHAMFSVVCDSKMMKTGVNIIPSVVAQCTKVESN